MNPINTSEADQEMDIQQLYLFLTKHIRKILFFTGIGLGLAILFLVIAPKKYEAITQIQMARVNLSNKDSPFALDSIEPPALLMARLRLPSTYTEEVINACGIPAIKLIDAVQIRQMRDTNTSIELKVRHETPTKAQQCSQAVFEMIKQQQGNLLQPFLDANKAKLAFYQKELATDASFLNKLEEQHNSSTFNFIKYIKVSDQIKYDIEQIDKLTQQLQFGSQITTVIAPTYVDPDIVTPKKIPTLIIGTLLGFLLGLALAFYCSVKARASAQSAKTTV